MLKEKLKYPSAGIEVDVLKKIASTRNNQTEILKILYNGEVCIMKVTLKSKNY